MRRAPTVRLLLALMLGLGMQIVDRGQTVQAQMRRCDSNRLSGSDLAASRQAIRRMAGRRKVLWDSGWSCSVNRSASTNVDLAPETQPDGSVIEPTLFCGRNHEKWRCEAVQNRYVTIEAAVAGRRPHIKVHLPAQFEVAEVNPLVQRAIDLAPDLQPNRECGYRPDPPGTTTDLQYVNEVKSAFAFAGDRLASSVDVTGGEITVEASDSYLTFTRNSQQPSQFYFVCWGMYIVVT